MIRTEKIFPDGDAHVHVSLLKTVTFPNLVVTVNHEVNYVDVRAEHVHIEQFVVCEALADVIPLSTIGHITEDFGIEYDRVQGISVRSENDDDLMETHYFVTVVQKLD